MYVLTHPLTHTHTHTHIHILAHIHTHKHIHTHIHHKTHVCTQGLEYTTFLYRLCSIHMDLVCPYTCLVTQSCHLRNTLMARNRGKGRLNRVLALPWHTQFVYEQELKHIT